MEEERATQYIDLKKDKNAVRAYFYYLEKSNVKAKADLSTHKIKQSKKIDNVKEADKDLKA